MPPLLFEVEWTYVLGEQIFIVLKLLNNDCFSIAMHSKSHLICLRPGFA